MKKEFIYLFIICSILSLFSCEDTDYQLYNKNDKDKLFFTKDTIRFTYGLNRDLEVDLNVQVQLIGFVNQSKDQTFQIGIVKEKTTAINGKHYLVTEANIMAKDSSMAYIPVDFQKLQLEKNKEYQLTLQLIENEHYAPTDIKECVILFDNKDIEAPVWWRAEKLGEYNQEKFILLVDYFHQSEKKSPVLFNAIKSKWGENLDQGTETNLLTIYQYQGFLNRYILTPMYEYYLETNNPMYQIPNPNN